MSFGPSGRRIQMLAQQEIGWSKSLSSRRSKSLSIRHLESDLEKLNEFLIEIQLFRLDQTQYSLYYVYHLQRDTTPWLRNN